MINKHLFIATLLMLVAGNGSAAQQASPVSTDEQLRAKKTAEAAHRNSSPMPDAPASSGAIDPQKVYAEKRAAEAMHVLATAGIGATRRVVDKPFEAEAVTETIQILADGNRVVRRNTTRYFRDRQGRTRREQSIQSVGASTAVAPFQLIVISDPVAQRDYIINPVSKTVRRFANFEVDDSPGAAQQEQARDLGKRTMEGLECTGSSRTIVIPAGRIGNEKAITTTTETWFAPAIEALVLSKTSDPRFGETTYTMHNVSLVDQPLSRFEPPAGYRIEFDGKPGVTRKRTDRP